MVGQCDVPHCRRDRRRRVWCGAHYQRWVKYGDPEHTERTPRDQTAEQRLRHHGWTATESGCWEWGGVRYRSGYGRVSFNALAWSAHRLAYVTWVGPIPEGMLVLHSCDNPPCINPDHLRVGTGQENMDDMTTRNRQVSGTSVHTARLTEDQVREIRTRYAGGGLSQSALAREYGVTQGSVWNIVNNRTWLGG